jgi:hypothetical protein
VLSRALESGIIAACFGETPVTSLLRILFFSSGSLSPQPFVIAAIAVYMSFALAQLLTVPAVIGQAGLWPFVLAQPMLVWMWFAIHAKRLRDAGRSAGAAGGIAILYLLAVALLLMVAASFFNTSAVYGDGANPTNVAGLVLLLSIFSVLSGSPDDGLVWIIVTALMLIACAPALIALGFSLWAATRPSARRQPS